MKNKVLFVAHDSSLYGANQSLLNMISSLSEKPITITVAVPTNGPICKVFDSLNILYVVLNYRSEIFVDTDLLKDKFLNKLRFLNNLIRNHFAYNKLKKLHFDKNFDIIHSNSSVVAIGEKFAFKNNIKHIWHLREYIDLDHKVQVYGGLEKYKIRIQNSENILCITNGIAKHFGVEKKAFILRDAVRKNSEKVYRKKDSNYFLFCGSLQEGKGVEIALEAFSRFKNENMKLLIAGTGTLRYETYLKQIVSELKINSKVQFLGFRDDIDSLMYNAKAFLMCSKNEALGRVTPEAMLNFCPVIGYNNAGTADIIENYKNGILYDNINGLIDILNRIVESDIDLELITKNAFVYAVENFLEDSFGSKLYEYYRKLMV